MGNEKKNQTENLKETEKDLKETPLNEDELDQVAGGSKTDIKTLLETIVNIITK